MSSGEVWDQEPSPWDSSGVVDGTTKNYFKLGMLGAILPFIGGLLISLVPLLVPSIVIIAFSIFIINATGSAFLAFGFLGLYRKYKNLICKVAALVSFLLGLWAITFIVMSFVVASYEFIALLSYISLGIIIISLILFGISFWNIRDRAVNNNLTLILAILSFVSLLTMFSGFFMYLPMETILLISPMISIGGLAEFVWKFLIIYFFYLEQRGEVQTVTQTW